MSEVGTTAFGLKDRQYGASCDSISPRLHTEKHGETEMKTQVTDLIFTLRNITPADMAACNLSPAAFPPRKKNDQMHLDETDGEPVDIAAIDGKYEPDLAETEGFNVIIRNENLGKYKLEPNHGIKVKKILKGASSTEAMPTVDMKISVKGLHFSIAGNPFRIVDWELEFEPKVGNKDKKGKQYPDKAA